MEQLDLFEQSVENFKINRPIRLCEFFAGVGFQRMGIERVFNVESWKICEWAVPSILAYDVVHNGKYEKNNIIDKDYLIDYLYNIGISLNYDDPATKPQIARLGLEKLQQIYSSIKRTNNLVNIMNIHAKDMNMIDADKYQYVWTYSFPCQDLSLAGNGDGFAESQANNVDQQLNGGIGTRSGLVWEIIRLLKELKESGIKELPLLVMENVTQVHGLGNIKEWHRLLNELSSLGYTNFWKDLNGKNYGIPQNRDRCFMISIYNCGERVYAFPKKETLKLRLKDILEDNVDEKYFLSKPIEETISINKNIEDGDFIDAYNKNVKKDISGTITTGVSKRNETFIAVKNATEQGYLIAEEGDGVDISGRMQYHRGTVQKGMAQTINTMGGNDGGVVVSLKRGYDCEIKQTENVDPNEINVIGNYSKSGFSQTSIVDKNGLAPTFTENHGQIISVVVGLKEQMCNQLIESGSVKENDVIRHSYTKNRMTKRNGTNCVQSENNLCSTLDTRCDCLGVCVNERERESSNQNLRIRKLTPLECLRLMGADDDVFYKLKHLGQLSDSQIYHIAGDGLIVDVMQKLFKTMKGSD